MATHFFHSGQANAPVLSGTAGALIAVLDACLVNGWGIVSVDSLVVASGVATATISAGHSADVDVVVQIAGATPAGLNGLKRVTLKTNQTVEFDATGIADGAATGSITMKVAPVGWVKEFSGTNVAAYKSSDPLSTACRLRVDDASAMYARVVGYETMSDVDSGAYPFPTPAQTAGGYTWHRSDSSGATARAWSLFADDRAFYLAVNSGGVAVNQYIYFFGDLVAHSAFDAKACALQGFTSTGHITNWVQSLLRGETAATGYLVAARSYTGISGAMYLSRNYDRLNSTTDAGSSGSAEGNTLAYPNPADSGLLLTPIRAYEPGGGLRATFPGLYAIPQSVTEGAISAGASVSGLAALPGRTLKAVTSYTNSFSWTAKAFLDCTGPWR